MLCQKQNSEEAYPVLRPERDNDQDYPRWDNLPQGDASSFPTLSLFRDIPAALINKAWQNFSAILKPVIAKIIQSDYAPIIKDRLWAQATSPEFWLGVVFGVATRVATRLALLSTLSSTQHLSSTITGFVACAGAGLSAGIIVHLIRMLYRNTHAAQGHEKEKYCNRALLESAIIGLFGGLIGGCATNAGALIARAGSLAVGTTAGVAAGIIHACVKEYGASHGEMSKIGWSNLVFQGAAFGAMGGILGIVASDLFSAHNSIAAPIGVAERMTYKPFTLTPASSSPVLIPAAPIEPIHCVVVTGPTTSTILETQGAPPPVLPPVTPTAAPLDPCHPVDPCRHIAKVKHVRHIKHAKHIVHAKPVMPMIEKAPLPLPPPPPTPPQVVPIAWPLHIAPPPPVDPCTTGLCGAPCDQSSQIFIKGPCGDPTTPCVERVSFNEHGDATKVVLEPRLGSETKSHFEVRSHPVAESPYWHKAAQDVSVNSHAESGEAKVSLVLPFVHPANLPFANAEPMPA